MKNLLFVLLGLGLMTGCDDDPDPIVKETPIEITINHVWGNSDFSVNTWYNTAQADSFKPTTLNYHINHIELVDANGNASQVSEWELVNFEKDGNKKLSLRGVADKSFTKIRFTIGVEDSVVNMNGELNDDFTDPMYWGMAMGYINLKLEGKRMKDGTEGDVYFHIGGYAGANQTARNIELDLVSNVEMLLGSNTAHVIMDVEQFFHSPNPISLSTTNDVQTTGPTAVMISENWDSMFTAE